MRKIWMFTPILLLLFLFPAISSAATHASFIYYVANGGKGTVPALVKSGTTFVPASLLEEAGLQVAQIRQIYGPNTLDGKKQWLSRLAARLLCLMGKQFN